LGEALAEEQPECRLVGFSTHVNVSVPDGEAVWVAELFARTCAAAFSAVVGPASQSGVLVRPRRGRLEVGCDHLAGSELLAAVAVVAACVRGLLSGERPPTDQESVVVPSREKFGYFVAAHGLAPPAPSVLTWVGDHVRALGLPPISGPAAGRYEQLGRERELTRDSFQELGPRERCGVRLSSAWLTWEHAVWSVHSPSMGRTCFAVVPAAAEPAFLAALDAGHFDEALHRVLVRRRQRILVTYDQIQGPSLWSGLRPGALVPAERSADGSVPKVRRSNAMRAWRSGDRS